MPAQRFIDWTWRLSAYQGVLAAMAAEEAQEATPGTPGGPRQVESTPTVLTSDPVLASLGDYAQVEGAVDG